MPDFTGQSTGRYHILESLGQGGMAVVYKAYDTSLDINVAIKFIRTERLSPEVAEKSLKRFKIEAQKTAKLTHPNIIPVTDYGDFNGVPFLVMRYIEGGKTLKSMLGKQIPWQEAVQTILPIAEALDYAHKNHIVHRDVKPSNILITKDGIPMLSDFGIAKVIEEEETLDGLTTAGMDIGTPEYMAPEQWEGKKVDGRADIYALGVVLYEMITGRPPFKADTIPATMVQVLRDPLPRPKQFVRDLPDPVESIIIKALAKDPANRYEKMAVIIQSLEIILTKKDTEKSTKKGILLLLVLGSLGIFLLILGIINGWFKLNPASIATEEFSPSIDINSQISTQFQTQESNVKPTITEFTPHKTEIIQTTQNSVVSEYEGQIAFETSRDGNKEIYLMNADGSDLVNLTNNTYNDFMPDWSPDGERIVFVSNRESDGNWQIYTMNADGTDVKKITSEGNNTTPKWSPDGSKIAFASYRDGGYMTLYLMNSDGTNPIKLTDNQSDHWYPTWSPDGKYLALVSNDPTPGEIPYSIFIIESDGSGFKKLTGDVHANETRPNWSPDGNWIVFSRDINPTRSDIMVVDVTGALKQLTSSGSGNYDPSWSPNGKWISFCSNRNGNFDIYVMRADGSGQIQITNDIADDWSPTWRPGG